MIQTLADHIDQLDLALDQLALHDRNFDRFALMLIDNVVELTLHTHARDRAAENRMLAHAQPRRTSLALARQHSGSSWCRPIETRVQIPEEGGLTTGFVPERGYRRFNGVALALSRGHSGKALVATKS